MTSIYNVQRLYYNELNIELSQFKYNLFISTIINWNLNVCQGIGWENEAVDLSLSMTSHWMECSKRLIYDFCETFNIWRGPEAKYFEDCHDSDEITADFTTWNFRDSSTDNIVKGSVYPKAAYACHKLPLVGKDPATTSEGNPLSAQENYATMAYRRVFTYAKERYDTTGALFPDMPSLGSIKAASKLAETLF